MEKDLKEYQKKMRRSIALEDIGNEEYKFNTLYEYEEDRRETLCKELKKIMSEDVELYSDEEVILKLIHIFIEDHYFGYKCLKYLSDVDNKIFDFIVENMDQELRKSQEFIKKINDPVRIVFASEELKKDKEFILELLKKDLGTYMYLDNELKVDKDVIEIVLDKVKEVDDIDDIEYIFFDSKIFCDEELIKLVKTNLKDNLEFMELYNSLQREQIEMLIKRTNTIVTHFGDDLDNKAAIHAIQCWAEDNDIIKIGHPITVERVPAGQIKEKMLNVDTGGHKGNRVELYGTIIIDGDPVNEIKSASASLAEMGIYVPEQIVELADTKPNKVSSLDSRSGLALVRYLSGEQTFKLAEAKLLDKSLTDEQLEEYGLIEAHKKQQAIIDNAVEKIEKYTVKASNGEKIVLAPEQILAGSNIAYEQGINYYVSAANHYDKYGEEDGVTFAITCKPEVKLPEEIIKYGQELVEKYRIDENSSGVFVNPNGQMIVAGGFKNPEFKIENETVKGILEKIKEKFIGRDLNKDEEEL